VHITSKMIPMLDDEQDTSLEPIHPGKRLRWMLEAKGWSQDELATIIGKRRQSVSSIVAGKTSVTPEMAIALGAAFGNEPAEWLMWSSAYELSNVPAGARLIEKRARLYEIAPIREMQKRGWITLSQRADDLQLDVERFFGSPVDSPITFPVAARRTVTLASLNPAEKAWCFRARYLAQSVLVERFEKERLPLAEKKLRRAAAYPKEARHISKILSDFGIRFVVVEPLPGAKLDGISFWLDAANPVIAVSIRFDRIDAFWFTFFHEFAHIKHGDAYSVDVNLLRHGSDGGISIPLAEDTDENRANETAADILIPHDELVSFMRRLAPYYSAERIIQFANKVRIHPGIIVGQLQSRREIGYGALRNFLVKIRSIVIETALTDGWGLNVTPRLV
jgi:HTH-type transcriptional regulator / antitoxin HigA